MTLIKIRPGKTWNFMDLPPGSYFEYNGKIYKKIIEIQLYDHNGNKEVDSAGESTINSMCLDNSKHCTSFSPVTKIKPIEVLVVEYEV